MLWSRQWLFTTGVTSGKIQLLIVFDYVVRSLGNLCIDKTKFRFPNIFLVYDIVALFSYLQIFHPPGRLFLGNGNSSKDYGSTYQKETFPSDAVITFFFVSPANYKNAIFVDYHNKTLHITTDELKTTNKVVVDFEIDKLVLHPTIADWVLAYSFLSRELRYSKDFGKTWNLLHTGVSPKFYWYIPGVDTDNSTVHLEILSSSGDSAHYKKCALEKCSATDTTDRKLGSFQPISLLIINQYVFVEKLKKEKSEMYVSYKRNDFKKAYFPPNTLPKHFLIMNADEDQVFVGVTNTDGVTLYLSDTTGQYYVPTLTDLLYVVRGIPWIDFHEVKSLKGIYLANQRSITENSRVRIEVKTLISFDKGGMWSVIPVPVGETSKCKQATDCSLHLHLDLGSLAAPGILSESKAPGLVLAHGNVGDKLDPNNTYVYVSRNGGVTWKNAGLPSGMYRFNILDQGSILTAVKEATYGVTNIIYYSYDQGNNWQNFKFSDKVLQVDGALNEPEINSLSLSIYGHTSGTTAWTLATIKFEQVLPSKCKKEDYEIWMPGDHTQFILLFELKLC
ncbi:hypothetical protein LOTGIDRAFT_160891 [Lottia gigantea]|uniref:VPS10 domain-containing protein n=1 Tax=Lottia gigantea TaxID=225164 RepID=V3ZUG4_LOTGI|nr:hypothetical protein LOTGIDRAFT_160891 [Lottia gigantea]ESO95128.1 hypothetical protein LOTGIDRAFT_160891 [Lottia gigantea]